MICWGLSRITVVRLFNNGLFMRVFAEVRTLVNAACMFFPVTALVYMCIMFDEYRASSGCKSSGGFVLFSVKLSYLFPISMIGILSSELSPHMTISSSYHVEICVYASVCNDASYTIITQCAPEK